MAATNRIRLLSRALVGQGVAVTVLCTRVSEKPSAVRNREPKGISEGVAFEYTTGTTVRPESFGERRYLEAKGDAVALERLLSLKRRRQVDAVYLWTGNRHWQPSPAGLVKALNIMHIPIVREFSERPWSLAPEATRIDRLISPLAGMDAVVAISDYIADWARAESVRLGRLVRIIQVPIVVDLGEQVVSDYPRGEPVVLMAVSPGYWSSIAFVLDAMQLVWQAFPTCKLVVTGVDSGSLHARRLGFSTADSSLDPRVILPGFVDRVELLRLYSKANALLAPLFDNVQSRARFPSKIAEYLASGRPVVTTGVGEVTRQLSHGRDAFLASPGSPRGFAAEIVGALSDRERADRVGRAGRRLAESRFDFTLYGPVLRELVAVLAAEHG